MIPIRDSIPSRSTPLVSYAILGTCVVVHLFQYVVPSHLIEWALIPKHLVQPAAWTQIGPLHVLATLITYQFLHGDVLHLGFNMLFLWVFGDNVEDRLGHGRFLMFYLACGVAAALVQSGLSWFPDTPMVGASGSIAGVLGAYFVLFRTAWIRSVLVFFIFPVFVDIPAVIFIGFWFVIQTLNALYSIGPISATGHAGVAFAAHAAGFVAGIGFLRLFARRRRYPKIRVVRWEVD